MKHLQIILHVLDRGLSMVPVLCHKVKLHSSWRTTRLLRWESCRSPKGFQESPQNWNNHTHECFRLLTTALRHLAIWLGESSEARIWRHYCPQLVLAMGPNSRIGSGSGSNPEPNRCNGFPHKTRHFNITTLPPIKYLSSDRIMIWSVRRSCSSNLCFTSRSQICDLTNIRWVAMENPRISLKFALLSQPLNEYQSDHKSKFARWKSGQNCTIYVLITSRYDENSHS